MKKWVMLILCTLLSLVYVCALAGAEINEVNYPDENFRNYVEKFDTDRDGMLSDEEIEAVKKIDCNAESVRNAKGIELFSNLESLRINENDLTALDLSRNTKLTYFECMDNSLLTTLEVSGNTELTELYCSACNLPELDLSRNTKLTYLDCADNALSALDVSRNTKLNRLECGNNKLTALHVGKNTALTVLGCSNNNLTTLDVSGSIALAALYCSDNKLTALDVSRNTALALLYCDRNELTKLDVSRNIKLDYLCCARNKLTTLNVNGSTKLRYLDCSDNPLSALDVGSNTNLMHLFCSGNRLSTLNVIRNTKLTYLSCHHNKISKLDLSKNTKLSKLCCNNTNLSELNISCNPNLEYLCCENNRISTLDVSQCHYLRLEVDGGKRNTRNQFDCFGRDEEGYPYLKIDKTVTVIAGKTISRPSVELTEATIDGLNYTLNNKKLTAVFTGPEDKKIKKLTVPDSIKVNSKTYKVTEIKAGSCKKLTKLTRVIIGKNVSKIGKDAFNGCKNAKEFIIKTAKLTAKSVESGAFKTGYRKTTTVKCPKKQVDEYQKILTKKGLDRKKTKFTK